MTDLINTKEMKKLLTRFLITTSVALISCQTAPKVVAELSENFSARSADSVKIFTMTDTVPSSARIIGTVKVKDGGLTPSKECLFPNMLALAVKKTAESGGNGFHIDEHKYPGFHGSTCHRVFGTMYLIPDSLITTDTRLALQNLEMYEEDVVQAKASQMITNIRDRRLNNPMDILKVSAGPSWIISEIQTYRKTYKSKSGFAFSADYQHIWGSGLGIGFNFMYFGTSFEPDGFDVDMYYCGPSIVGSLKVGQKWRWDSSIGVGYSEYTEKILPGRNGTTQSERKAAMLFQTGIEYMFSKHVGIGLQMNLSTMTLDKPKGYGDKYDFYGIRRIDPQLGVRWYL